MIWIVLCLGKTSNIWVTHNIHTLLQHFCGTQKTHRTQMQTCAFEKKVGGGQPHIIPDMNCKPPLKNRKQVLAAYFICQAESNSL